MTAHGQGRSAKGRHARAVEGGGAQHGGCAVHECYGAAGCAEVVGGHRCRKRHQLTEDRRIGASDNARTRWLGYNQEEKRGDCARDGAALAKPAASRLNGVCKLPIRGVSIDDMNAGQQRRGRSSGEVGRRTRSLKPSSLPSVKLEIHILYRRRCGAVRAVGREVQLISR